MLKGSIVHFIAPSVCLRFAWLVMCAEILPDDQFSTANRECNNKASHKDESLTSISREGHQNADNKII